jgi:enoyl-CoA hydratase/carnithine racemase
VSGNPHAGRLGEDAMSDLLFDIHEKVATITLNRPDKKNTFTPAMIHDWADALRECQASDTVNVIVQTSAGDSYCAGGDVGRMSRNAEAQTETAFDQKEFIWTGANRVPIELALVDKPYLVAVNGVAAGAGMDMALLGDLIFAAQSARFAETYIRVGLVPGDGGGWLLPRMIGLQRALEMLLLGDFISAEQAERYGIVNKVLPDADLMPHTLSVAARLAAGPSIAQRYTKRLVLQGLTMDFRAHLDQVTSHIPVMKATADHKEAVRAFVEKRKPAFTGK